jgi:streptomycin 6-kinase
VLQSLPRRLMGDSAYGSAEMLNWDLLKVHASAPFVAIFVFAPGWPQSARRLLNWSIAVAALVVASHQ